MCGVASGNLILPSNRRIFSISECARETELILKLETLRAGAQRMSKCFSRKELFEFLEVIFEEGSMVKYQNPDVWIRSLHKDS